MRLRTLLSTAFVFCAAATAMAQDEQPWKIVFFPAGEAAATESINQVISTGYIPVGIEVTEGESLAVLFVRRGSHEVRNWAILDYDDWNSLEAEITGGIEDGFVPMDISRYGERLAVLWVGTDIEIAGWRVSTSTNTIGERTRTINDFQSQGFTLWGLSVHEGLAWYLFLRTPGTPPAGAVSGYRSDTAILQSGMVEASKAGWLPNGIAQSQDTIYICYVR